MVLQNQNKMLKEINLSRSESYESRVVKINRVYLQSQVLFVTDILCRHKKTHADEDRVIECAE